MKIWHFTILLIDAFKNHPWAEVKQIRQCPDGWAFVIVDKANNDEYVCVAYPVRSQKIVVPDTADQLIQRGEL
jgi:hypothetical protein